MDDPGRPDRGRVPRRRGASSGSPRRGRRASSASARCRSRSERKLMSTLAGRRRARGRRRRRHQGRARRPARPLHHERVGRRRPAADRRAPRARSWPTSTGSPTRPCARSPSPTGRCRGERSRDAGRRGGRARARLPRHRRHHRPAAAGGADGDRRGARAPGSGSIMITGDHPRTAARIAADLGIVGAGARALTGRRHRRARRRGAPGGRPRDRPCTPGSRPSTSCGSSTPCRPTGTSWP